MSDMSVSASLVPAGLSGAGIRRGSDGPSVGSQPSARSGRERPAVPPVLRAAGLVKRYRRGQSVVSVLRGADLNVPQGQFLAVVGQSGSGKSTLLHLLGTLDQPDAGQIWFENQRIDNVSAARRDALRNSRLAMVFQFYHLLPELSALENVMLPGMIGAGVWRYLMTRRSLRQRAASLLEQVGLSARLHHRPRELSGGEMQRVAIARALVSSPSVLLADEPTGNLDRQTGHDIVGILRRLNQEEKLTIVMVTHDDSLARHADATMRLVEGQVEQVE